MNADLTHALKALTRTPVMAAVVIVSLGVGIGVNTVVFSWIQALVLRPLPGVVDAGRFHMIEPLGDGGVRPGASWQEYQALQSRLSAFTGLTAFRMAPLSVGETARTSRTNALLVAGNYFTVLGVRPALGRTITPAEVSQPGGAPVVVVSSDYWRTQLGAASDVVGRTLRVNDVDLAIVGVTPDGFQGTVLGLQFDLWVPATLAPTLLAGSRELDDRTMRGYYVMGALAPGSELASAEAEAAAAMAQLARDFPDSNRGFTARVLPFWRASRGPQEFLLPGLAVLQGAMLLLFFAVGGNVALLLLARAHARTREFGIRLALGAGVWRIARSVVVENLVLAVPAVALGALVTYWSAEALRAMPILTTQFPVRFQAGLNAGTLVFASVLGIVGALAVGLAPVLHLRRTAPQEALRASAALAGRGGAGSALTAVQAALAVMVLVAAGLFVRNFQAAEQVETGFTSAGVLLAAYDLTGRDADDAAALRFAERLLTTLRVHPDVESAAIATAVPLDIHGLPTRTFTLEGRPRADGSPDRVRTNVVSDGYFTVLRMPLTAGRDLAPIADAGAIAEVVVNDAFVSQYAADGAVLGRRITVSERPATIVGIVRTALADSFAEPPTPVVFLSYRDRPADFGELHVRARRGDEQALAPAIRRAVRDVDAALPVYNVRTLTQHVEMNLALRRIPARMFAVLGPLILALVAIGVYAVVSGRLAQRTAEIGIRLALGATAGRVRAEVITEHLQLVVGGAVMGWVVAAYVVTRLPGGELDPAVFAGAPLLLLGVAVAASWVPARRASRLDPVAALRTE